MSFESNRNRLPFAKVLVLEPHHDLRHALGRLLRIFGLNALVAGCGAEASAIVDASPDLAAILSRTVLPDGVVFDLLPGWKAKRPQALAICMSCRVDDPYRDAAVAAGFEHYLTLPLSIDDVVNLLEPFLTGHAPHEPRPTAMVMPGT